MAMVELALKILRKKLKKTKSSPQRASCLVVFDVGRVSAALEASFNGICICSGVGTAHLELQPC